MNDCDAGISQCGLSVLKGLSFAICWTNNVTACLVFKKINLKKVEISNIVPLI